MKVPTLTFALIVLVFSLVQFSYSKQICRCDSNLQEYRVQDVMKRSVTCGEQRNLYCYNYATIYYCEVANANDGFKKCCTDYGPMITGLACMDI